MHSAKLVNPIRNNLFTNRELGEEENSSLREFKDMLPVRFGLGVGRCQFKNEPETFHTADVNSFFCEPLDRLFRGGRSYEACLITPQCELLYGSVRFSYRNEARA